MTRKAIFALAVLLSCTVLAADDAEQRVRQLMDVWGSGDVSGLEALVVPDVVYDDVPNAHRFEGVDGVRRYVRHVHAWADRGELEIVKVQSSDNAATAEWVMRGIQARPIPGRIPVATNRAFELKGVTIVELREGRIARAADYLDVLGFVIQLGGRVELPGGVVIPPDDATGKD